MQRRWWAAGAGIVALAVAAATGREPGRRVDRRIFAALNSDRGPAADAVFTGITELGSIGASAGAAAVLAAAGRRREAVDAVAAAGAMWLLGQALKRVFLRPRPYQAGPPARLLIAEPNGTSWPSSHPAVLLAFATVASRDLELDAASRFALVALAATVGISRVHVGVHYPSDVAGGLLLGRAVADGWSAIVSPHALSRPPSVAAPGDGSSP
jgi:undecaprenyl-diphosphatase